LHIFNDELRVMDKKGATRNPGPTEKTSPANRVNLAISTGNFSLAGRS